MELYLGHRQYVVTPSHVILSDPWKTCREFRESNNFPKQTPQFFHYPSHDSRICDWLLDKTTITSTTTSLALGPVSFDFIWQTADALPAPRLTDDPIFPNASELHLWGIHELERKGLASLLRKLVDPEKIHTVFLEGKDNGNRGFAFVLKWLTERGADIKNIFIEYDGYGPGNGKQSMSLYDLPYAFYLRRAHTLRISESCKRQANPVLYVPLNSISPDIKIFSATRHICFVDIKWGVNIPADTADNRFQVGPPISKLYPNLAAVSACTSATLG